MVEHIRNTCKALHAVPSVMDIQKDEVQRHMRKNSLVDVTALDYARLYVEFSSTSLEMSTWLS